MSMNPKVIFLHYLNRLEMLLGKIDEGLFDHRLSPNMFSLAVNGKIAANFALRGYCPLLGKAIPQFGSDGEDKASVCQQVAQTIDYLQGLDDPDPASSALILSEKAGFNEVSLPAEEFLHLYILPNFLFHISMVYANARAAGLEISKGDYDGFHQYPDHFSFLTEDN